MILNFELKRAKVRFFFEICKEECVEQEEKEKLIQRGFVLWKREKISDKDSPDYGKYEQMWVKFYEQA